MCKLVKRRVAFEIGLILSEGKIAEFVHNEKCLTVRNGLVFMYQEGKIGRFIHLTNGQ